MGIKALVFENSEILEALECEKGEVEKNKEKSRFYQVPDASIFAKVAAHFGRRLAPSCHSKGTSATSVKERPNLAGQHTNLKETPFGLSTVF